MLDIINLANGAEVVQQMCLVRCLCSPICPGISGSVTHSAGGAVSTCSYSVGDDGFTALVMLQPGVNHIVAQYGTHMATRQIVFSPIQIERFVRLIYVTSFDEDKFQGPKDMDRSANAAVRRIQTGVLALQTFLAESLQEEGLGRKTFKLELTPKGLPKVHVLQLPLPMHEVQRQREERLWEVVAMQVLSTPHLADPNCKYLAFLGATRYANPSGSQVSSEATVVSLTKGHVSLGGGGLALVGTGALYSWPEQPSQLLAAFADNTPVDSSLLMDFSGGRGTWGACFGTHLGSVLHELGHTFDLGHTKHGIMARGFEDLHIFFTAPLLHCSFAKHNARFVLF
ncbi:hypothetical protein HAZT_HAZT003514 [Hyalella azteca]|uniref:Uncharacterized protein n=1 Tax=Hyalella azteca TaxID=294128 RepID=A0A6A0HD79_HYAAZ|nr:hypothetical protein HAZT_HAZT003514 [Hyalella azteca]